MPIKLLALDIDGTLLTTHGELTPGNRVALERAASLGVRVMLLTGRRFGSARLLLQQLGLNLPLVSHNGALTKDVETLETLDFHPLDDGIARNIVCVGREAGVDMICCDDPHGLGTMVIEGVSSANRALNGYLQRYREAVVEVDDLLGYIDHPPVQMLFSGTCALMDEFAALLEREMDGRVRLFKTRYRSIDLTILDVLSLTASKGESLAAMARLHGIARDEIMAIGDNHNDLPMLDYAGTGVVMANADDELKAMNFAVTASNENDGVALAIEKFIFGRQTDNNM